MTTDKWCICNDPQNCIERVPDRRCKKDYLSKPGPLGEAVEMARGAPPTEPVRFSALTSKQWTLAQVIEDPCGARDEIERLRPMAESWESYEAAQERKAEVPGSKRQVAQALRAWYDACFINGSRLRESEAELLISAVRLLNADETNSNRDLVLARNALGNLVAALRDCPEFPTQLGGPHLQFAYHEACRLMGPPYSSPKTKREPPKCLVADCPEPTSDGQAMCAEHMQRIEP